jgi:hypothetical protein
MHLEHVVERANARAKQGLDATLAFKRELIESVGLEHHPRRDEFWELATMVALGMAVTHEEGASAARLPFRYVAYAMERLASLAGLREDFFHA